MQFLYILSSFYSFPTQNLTSFTEAIMAVRGGPEFAEETKPYYGAIWNL